MNTEEHKNIENYVSDKEYKRKRPKRKVPKILKIIFIVLVFIAIGVYIFLQLPQFGKAPSGERLERIKNSPNYKNGRFQNLEIAPNIKEESSLTTKLNDFFLKKSERTEPSTILPSVKMDLKALKPDENIMVWFGHSSYFLQIDGKKILIDPVFSGNASPVNFTNKSYEGSDIYSVDDIPDIDYLLISHDHFDHLDYETAIKLIPRIKKVITGLGVGAHFERWGYDKNSIIERDWNETEVLGDGFEITVTPARHRSSRGLKSNQTLWASFVIKTPNMKFFYSGDTGYGSHFEDIGNNYGPFNFAIMECGQYSKYWPYSHMMPEEVVQATLDLKAEKLMPGHWAKFSLSLHDWDEPINRVIEVSKAKNLPVLYPMIGEKVDLKETSSNKKWWQGIE